MTPDRAAIRAAAEALRRGELVAFPTETVYGLGAHALDVRAVAKIFEAKGRPRFDPLIVHVADPSALEAITATDDPRLRTLAERFWPGPLTLVVPKRPEVPDLVTAGHTSVAVRVPAHPVAQALLQEAAIPVAAPSANRFGAISPTRAEHVRGQLDVQHVLDGGPCDVGVESTILSLLEPEPTLLRAGGLPLEALEGALGRIRIPEEAALMTLSPGRQTRHYAPRTPLRLSEAPTPAPEAGLLSLGPAPIEGWGAVEVLSATSDLAEAASNLFAAMRRLDAAGLERIYATEVPAHGLGLAIRDRLSRAADKTAEPCQPAPGDDTDTA